MWDRNDTHPWSWKSGRSLLNQYCAQTPSPYSSSPQPPPAQDPAESLARECKPHSFHSFRTYIDREIARDPYGLLFGKRLESPPSTNNSSWTSFSWIFQPKAPTTDPVADQPTQQTSSSGQPPTTTQPFPSSKQPTVALNKTLFSGSSGSATTEEYQYDPITMRKVPKMKDHANPMPEQPFLKSLFAEHGVDIPVKSYKPHRVFGYGLNPTSQATPSVEATEKPESRFATSRKAELSSLMAQSKGNHIDTTAQFTDGPRRPIENETTDPERQMQARPYPDTDDTAPLFSGTTYESRSWTPGTVSSSTPDWLSREGFRPSDQSPANKKTLGDGEKIFESKLEPALDRMAVTGAKIATTSSTSASIEAPTSQTKAKLPGGDQSVSKKARDLDQPQHISEDDIDLLRASDVRAATRSARVSKQQVQSSKRKTRSELESYFTKHQAAEDETHNLAAKNITKTAGQISESLTNIWNHIKDYPSGIVARTMQSTGAFNDNYKKYVKPGDSSHLTEKLVFKDENLSKTPSIYRSTTPPSLKSSSPSSKMCKEEAEGVERMERLRAANRDAENADKITNMQLSQLAAEVRTIYEEERGPILEQPITSQANSGISKREPEKVIESSEGKAVENIDLEGGILERQVELQTAQSDFQSIEPAHEKSTKLRDVMDGAKVLRRELHETGMAIRAIESGRPQTVWNTPSPSSTNFGNKRMELTDRRSEPRKVDQEHVETTVPNASDRKMSKQSALNPPKNEKHQVVPPPVFTPSGSPVWNDEQPPPIESLREEPLQSTFAILAPDQGTKKIALSYSDDIPVSSGSSTSAVLVLSKLRYAAHYLHYFERLEREGYELYTGARNMLIFRKREPIETGVACPQSKTSIPVPPSPLTTDGVGPAKEAATVLDEIPRDVDPSPGPAAPTAPPGQIFQKTDQRDAKSRVRRQEEVFSGTKRSGDESTGENEYGDGFWKRLTRGVRRVALTSIALGGVAYTVGVVAEGIGAQTQIQNGIDDGHVPGPRKRVVMNGQRSGIYSTESSR